MEANYGPVGAPGPDEAITATDAMPRSASDPATGVMVFLDKVVGGLLVERSQAEIDAELAPYRSGQTRQEQFIAAVDGELDWLDNAIPLIPTMTAAQVRDVVLRLAQENRGMLRAWKFVAKRV